MRKVNEKGDVKTNIQMIRVDLESLSLSINDDEEGEEQPLIQATVSNLVVKLRSQE